MSGNNIFSSFPFTQSDPGFGPGAPRGAGGGSGWEIESFSFCEGQLASDDLHELWHPTAVDQTGLGFIWAIPRIGFTTLEYFASIEQAISGGTDWNPGYVDVYGINSTWDNSVHLMRFQKGLSSVGFLDSWKYDIGVDVSIYGGIGFVMDPAFFTSDVDSAHVVKQISQAYPAAGGILPRNFAGMYPKVLGGSFPEIIAPLTLIGVPNEDPKFLMTHYMKVGVS